MMAIGAHANDHRRRTDSAPAKSAHPGGKGQLNRTLDQDLSQYANRSQWPPSPPRPHDQPQPDGHERRGDEQGAEGEVSNSEWY